MSQSNVRRSFYYALLIAGALIWIATLFSSGIAQESPAAKRGVVLTLNGPVTPTSADYLTREMTNADLTGADLVIIEIDTPGGLVTSMKDIIKGILASETPVVTYVSPQGAQSASAGLYIMYAAHVSAMAPATNTGSATPIQMGGGDSEPVEDPFSDAPVPSSEDEETTGEEVGEATEESDSAQEETGRDAQPVDISNEASMRGKIIEDSVAYIRSLAELRGRNADWAEKAVRPPSASVTANEALELNVIDVVATDIDDLLEQIDGKVVETANGEVTISTDGISLERIEPSTLERILAFFADPSVAAILLSLGTLGLTVELWNPGSIFPGAIGIVCLLLAFYSFSILPYNGLFFAVIGLGFVLLVTEAFTPTFGLAGLTGLAMIGIGLYFLFPGEFRLSPAFLASMMAVGGAFLALILFAVVGSRSHGPLIGAEAIRKREGKVDEWDNEKGTGMVIVDGERWRARSKQPLSPGDKVKVIEIDGLVLDVKSAQAQQGTLSRMMPGRKDPV